MPRALPFYCPENKVMFETMSCENPLCGVETVVESVKFAGKGLSSSECKKLGIQQASYPTWCGEMAELYHCNELEASCCEQCCQEHEKLYPEGIPSWQIPL